MSLAEITRAAKGSIENNYSDGVFTESKVSAARMARTIVNGVSNNARVETIVQNSDAIDGVKFVGTLDGKTCPYCASYDGYIWRGEEIAEARRPPIHPNCRCCLIPYVELKDEEGNVVDVDGERPAANADFDKLAQDAYNERAREKGWKRRWDDLSPSTRLKYYYQAQKDFEAETGKPAYRQVSGATTFQEYFHRQPDSFKRAWLGAKRYELYKAGKLKEKNIFKPDLTYQVSVEDLRLDGMSLGEAIRVNGYKEYFKREELEENLKRREESEMLEGFEEQKTWKKAGIFIKEKLNIDADYSKIPIEVANDMNQELIRAYNIFGTVGIIENIRADQGLVERGAFGNYNRKTKTITLRPNYGRLAAQLYIKNATEGKFSTKSPLHGYRHEIGHAILKYSEESLDRHDRLLLIDNLEKIRYESFLLSREGYEQLSEYANDTIREMVAEAVAQVMNGEASPLTKKILSILRGNIYGL